MKRKPGISLGRLGYNVCMFRFSGKLLRAAAIDTVRSMGTTALAVGVGISIWAVLQMQAFNTGGMHAVLLNWDYGLMLMIAAWLAVLAYRAHRHFPVLLREYRRVFQLVALNQDQTSDPDRISIWCNLKFCKDIAPANVTVRVTTLLGSGPNSCVIHTETLERIATDQTKRLVLGSLRIAKPHRPPYHSIWGSEPGMEELKQGQVPILVDSSYLIDISVGQQTCRCYVEFVTPPPGALSAAMWLTDEDRSPWILQFPHKRERWT